MQLSAVVPILRKDMTRAPRTSPDNIVKMPQSVKSSIPSLQAKKNVTFAPDARRHEGFHPDAAPFRPAPRPISFLNSDSVPDIAVEKAHGTAANIGKPMRPIGSDTPIHNNDLIQSMHDGPAFVFDKGAFIGHSRYFILANIPVAWTEVDENNDTKLAHAMQKSGLSNKLASIKILPTGDETVEAFLLFDDIRDAEVGPEYLSTIHSSALYRNIDHHNAFALEYKNSRGKDASAYDGQIDFSVTFHGPTSEFNFDQIYNQVREFAESFGDIRAISVFEGPSVNRPRFRVEYFKLTHADNACELGDFKELYELTDDLIIDIKPYLPTSGVVQRRIPPPPRNAGLNQASNTGRVRPHYRRQRFTHHGGFNNHGLHTSQVPYDVAPEYRNYIPDPNYVKYVPSGIHDEIDTDMINRIPRSKYLQPQTVCPWNILEGKDCRTTVMVRNIPNKLNAEDLKYWLDITSRGLYDFSYLRIDFSNNCNVGYAFVNFIRPENIAHFFYYRVGKPWNMFGSEKTCEISYATVQGNDCLVSKFRNSSVMREWKSFRPRVFYTVISEDIPEGKHPGDEYEFPAPDNSSKLQRSLDNAQAIGLYPPRSTHLGHRGRANHSGNRGQWDRGTPRAIFEERAMNNQDGHMLNGQYLVNTGPTPFNVVRVDDRYFTEVPQHMLNNVHNLSMMDHIPEQQPTSYWANQGRSRQHNHYQRNSGYGNHESGRRGRGRRNNGGHY